MGQKLKKIISFFIIWQMFCFSGFAANSSLPELEKQAYDLFQNKQYDAAIKVTIEALEITVKEFGSDSLAVAKLLGNLGALYQVVGNEVESQKYFDKAKKIRKEHGQTGISVGIESEVFFDQAEKGKNSLSHPESVQKEAYPQCDADSDGDCDDADLSVGNVKN